MSTFSEEGVIEVRNEVKHHWLPSLHVRNERFHSSQACDRLLAHRVDIKLKSRKVNDVLNRLHVTQPQKRDERVRAPFIPDGVLRRMESMQVTNGEDQTESTGKQKKKTERDLEVELEEDYHLDLRKNWLLNNEDERYDILPEIHRNKNIADFIDPEIMKKLEELEEEEEARDEAGFYDLDDDEDDEETTAIRKLAKKIRYKRQVIIGDARSKKQARRTPSVPRPKLPIDRERLESTMSGLGIDMDNKEDVRETLRIVEFEYMWAISSSHITSPRCTKPAVDHWADRKRNVNVKIPKAMFEAVRKYLGISRVYAMSPWRRKHVKSLSSLSASSIWVAKLVNPIEESSSRNPNICVSHLKFSLLIPSLSLFSSFRQTIIRQNRSKISFVLFFALLTCSESK